jgi:hypothetical protein
MSDDHDPLDELGATELVHRRGCPQAHRRFGDGGDGLRIERYEAFPPEGGTILVERCIECGEAAYLDPREAAGG